MKLVRIAAGDGNVTDGNRGCFHHLRRFRQTHPNEVFLGRTALAFFKQLAEITAVELAYTGNFLNGKRPVIILLYKGNRFVNVEIPKLMSLRLSPGRGRLNECIQKDAQMADLMER